MRRATVGEEFKYGQSFLCPDPDEICEERGELKGAYLGAHWTDSLYWRCPNCEHRVFFRSGIVEKIEAE